MLINYLTRQYNIKMFELINSITVLLIGTNHFNILCYLKVVELIEKYNGNTF